MTGTAWIHVSADLRETAERVCSPRELEVLKLRAAGLGTTEIGAVLGIRKQNANTLLRRAAEKLRKNLPQEAMERMGLF